MYLSGTPAGIAADLAAGRLGLLNTPASGYRLDGVAVWAMDNGCFTGVYPGLGAYLALLDRMEPHRDRCLFVACPDVVGAAEATLEWFDEVAPIIHAAGWPVALVGQDGMEHLPVPWWQVDWLFVGGSTDWKLGPGAAQLIAQAQAHHVRVHVGRVNSWRRFHYFHQLGCDTADGTYIAHGPDRNAPTVRRWVDRARTQLRLFTVAAP